jgi:hypothetical protein
MGTCCYERAPGNPDKSTTDKDKKTTPDKGKHNHSKDKDDKPMKIHRTDTLDPESREQQRKIQAEAAEKRRKEQEQRGMPKKGANPPKDNSEGQS